MTTTSQPTPATHDELIKVKAREQVASRKLFRLKERYDKLKSITDTLFESQSQERVAIECRLKDSLALNEELAVRCQSLQDEAAMWKAQLFEQLDRLDNKHEEFLALQTELHQAQWQMVELLNEERHLCETERARSEARVDSLQKELTAARARVDGLKNLGACLAAKLERATDQRKVLQREHARLTELCESKEQRLLEKELQIEELRAQLFDARGQLLSQQLASSDWSSLKVGLAPAPQVAPVPSAEETPVAAMVVELETTVELPPSGQRFPSGERRPVRLAGTPATSREKVSPLALWSRATKTVGSWLKLRQP